jgi:hypothetical protein
LALETKDGNERAELWERDNQRLNIGSDVWYGFSIYIDGPIGPTRQGWLIIGQLKETGGGFGQIDNASRSPITAQRFNAGIFTLQLSSFKIANTIAEF